MTAEAAVRAAVPCITIAVVVFVLLVEPVAVVDDVADGAALDVGVDDVETAGEVLTDAVLCNAVACLLR